MTTIPDLLVRAHDHWDDADALADLGAELHTRNRLELAERVLRRALELDRTQEHAWLHLAFVHLRGYRPDRGMKLFDEAIEATGSNRIRCTYAAFQQDPKKQQALLDAAADDDHPRVRILKASVELRRGVDGAMDELEAVHEAHGDDPEVRESWWWTLLGRRAQGGEDAEDLRERAIPACDESIEDHPDRIMPHWMKAQMLLVEEDWEALRASTAAALERFPDEETQMYLHGRALEGLGDDAAALQWYARAIGAKPSYAGARIALGKLYEKLGDQDHAEATFRELPDANPDYLGGPMALAAYLARRERWNDAEQVFLDTWSRAEPWQRGRLSQQPELQALYERDRVKTALSDES